MLLELKLLQGFVDFQSLSHQLQALRANVPKGNFLDVAVGVASLEDSNQAIILQVNVFEVKFFHWVVWVGDQRFSDEDSGLRFQVFILRQIQLCDIFGSWSSESILEIEGRLKIKD